MTLGLQGLGLHGAGDLGPWESNRGYRGNVLDSVTNSTHILPPRAPEF